MKSRSDEYREKAEYCEDMSRQAATAVLRASWLRLAAKWWALRMKYPGQANNSLRMAVPRPGDSEPLTSDTSRADCFFSEMSASEHFVQLYEGDGVFLDTLARFVGLGLKTQEAAIVITTPSHAAGLNRRLDAMAIDIAGLRRTGQFILLDAEETISRFLVDGWPDDCRFSDVIGENLRLARGAEGRRVRAFGEMVALLWHAGCHAATVRLEHLWHDACRQHAFPLFCAYPRTCFPAGAADGMAQLLATHSKVLVA